MVDVAIVGAGIMGTNHGRVLSMIPDARVTAVFDRDPERSERLAAAVGAKAVGRLDDVAECAEAAVVATPTAFHEEVAGALLEAGVHLLVEKPLADSVEAGRRLVEAARASGRTLMAGHVERFNPVVIELRRVLRDIVHMDFCRIGPRSTRIDDDVVLDLMIHDLDLALDFTASGPARVSGVGRRVAGPRAELACALVEFDNGMTANITASQLGQNKIRRVEVTQRDGYVTADLLRQDLLVSRVSHTEFVSEEGMRYRQTGVVEVPFIETRGEPLFLELSHFVECVATGRRPVPSGEDALAALSLALDIQAIVEG